MKSSSALVEDYRKLGVALIVVDALGGKGHTS